MDPAEEQRGDRWRYEEVKPVFDLHRLHIHQGDRTGSEREMRKVEVRIESICEQVETCETEKPPGIYTLQPGSGIPPISTTAGLITALCVSMCVF